MILLEQVLLYLFRRLFVVLAIALAPLHAQGEALPIRIGLSLSLTGSLSEFGRLHRNGYQLWEAHVNQRGGILGRKVELIVRDDKSEPQTAQRIYEELILKDKVELLFSPYSSPITLAVAPVVERHGYSIVVTGAASEEIWNKGYKNIFGILPAAGRFAVGFLALLANASISQVAIVTTDDIFPASVASGARKWAPQYGITVAANIVEPRHSPDFLRAAELARQSGAQAVVLAGYLEEAIQMRRALKKIGWMPAAYYAATGGSVQKYAEQLGNDANMTCSTSLWEANEDLFPRSLQFAIDYRARFSETPTQQAAAPYAAGQVLEAAILKAGTTERSALRRALSSLDMATVIGRFSVGPDGMLNKRFPVVFQWQDGRREIVWPPEAKTAELLIHR
ncbi:MAG TPA: amino acid ABC transporter substrate-binding protein [Noviherbaspirillum sp.]|uniref:amino acid ABC transporter substrate-binding protein n=1 Tax=Noviherbaspirillum sp. TaxID=1926288 RepID=UPI002D4F2A03|nr:amino acid ABC transporter substrate-binding protein [Noviherbaspirillum sp.]HYD95902.1 amino acid ABC transporter substrate-binding protein [Noviherbaspirillum sp.]